MIKENIYDEIAKFLAVEKREPKRVEVAKLELFGRVEKVKEQSRVRQTTFAKNVLFGDVKNVADPQSIRSKALSKIILFGRF